MFASAVLTALVFAVSQVSAHGGVLSYQINGQHYQGYVIILFCFADDPDSTATQLSGSCPTTPLRDRPVSSANGTLTTRSPPRPTRLSPATPTARPSAPPSSPRPSLQARRSPRTGSERSQIPRSNYARHMLTLGQPVGARDRPCHGVHG